VLHITLQRTSLCSPPVIYPAADSDNHVTTFTNGKCFRLQMKASRQEWVFSIIPKMQRTYLYGLLISIMSHLQLSTGQNTIYNYFGRMISVFNIVIYFGNIYKELLWRIIVLKCKTVLRTTHGGLKPDGQFKSWVNITSKTGTNKLYTERISFIKHHIIFKNCTQLCEQLHILLCTFCFITYIKEPHKIWYRSCVDFKHDHQMNSFGTNCVSMLCFKCS
jgi:hypothetical protein